MTPGRMACALAVFTVLCVLAIFLFPGMEGPYSAVHGPVTALLSIRAALRMRVAIRAAVRAVRGWLSRFGTGLMPLSWHACLRSELSVDHCASGSASVLRC